MSESTCEALGAALPWAIVAILGFISVGLGLAVWVLQHHARKRG